MPQYTRTDKPLRSTGGITGWSPAKNQKPLKKKLQIICMNCEKTLILVTPNFENSMQAVVNALCEGEAFTVFFYILCFQSISVAP